MIEPSKLQRVALNGTLECWRVGRTLIRSNLRVSRKKMLVAIISLFLLDSDVALR